MLITNKSWENIAQLRNLGEKKKWNAKSFSHTHTNGKLLGTPGVP